MPLTTAKITLFFAPEPSAKPTDTPPAEGALNPPGLLEMTRSDEKTPASTTRQLRAQFGEVMPDQDKELSGSVVTIVTAAPNCCSNCCLIKR